MAFLPIRGTKLDPSMMAEVILTNSLTYHTGDAIKCEPAGIAAFATAGVPLLGIIMGFKSNDGSAMLQPAQVTKGTTAYPAGIDTYTAASDNQTVAKVKAIVSCDISAKWSAACNGTVGTTNASDLIGGRINVDSAGGNYDRVLESTNTRTAATVANFFDWGVDPDDSTRLIVSIASSELYNKQA